MKFNDNFTLWQLIASKFIRLTPTYFVMLGKVNKKWDSLLRSLIEEGYTFTYNEDYRNILELYSNKHGIISPKLYHVMLGQQKIWIQNHPYGSFTPPIESNHKDIRPKASTIYLLSILLEKHIKILM